MTLSNPTWYNHRGGNGPRWFHGVSTLNNSQNASFRSAWLGNTSVFAGGMWNWDEAEATSRTGDPFNAADNADDKHYRRAWDSQGGGLGTTLLGYVDVDGSVGDFWMTVESPIFARSGSHGGRDFVHFGYGDASVGSGAIGERTDVADATFVPEPTGLMLLSLGVLAIRRRR